MRRFPGRTDLGYSGAALLNVIAIILLFPPWLTVHGIVGSITATGFGQVTGLTSSMVNAADSHGGWVYLPPRDVLSIGCVFAALAVAAGCITVGATMAHWCTRSDVFGFVATGSSIAMADMLLGQLLTINGKAAQMRSLTTLSQNSTVHTVVSPAAIAAIIITVAAAVCTVTARVHQSMSDRTGQTLPDAAAGSGIPRRVPAPSMA